MDEVFDPGLKAHVLRDDQGRIRAIRHSDEHWAATKASPMEAASEYLREQASVYEIPIDQLANLHVAATHFHPEERGIEYRLAEETQRFDATTIGFDQTYLNTPVWRAGLKVTIKTGPNRVVHSVDTSHPKVEAALPPRDTIERYRRLFQLGELLRARAAAGEVPADDESDEATAMVLGAIGVRPKSKREARTQARFIRGRFWIYRYDPDDRLPRGATGSEPNIARNRDRQSQSGETPEPEAPLTLPLPPVDEGIEPGRHYLVAETTFERPLGDREHLTWQALVELETGSVLYLRALASELTGMLFLQDPPTKTGNTALTSASSNATLNPHRDTTTLLNLDPPVGGTTQHLRGTYGEVVQVEGLNPGSPTQPSGSNFHYDTRTNDFAAVSAYFHVDRIFRTIADLGFTISGPSGYFKNTSFPVAIDHRCWSGNTINAHCIGNGAGGIGHVGYGLMDTTDTTNPLGRAADPRVHWHELCGHGILYENVNSANFGFAHSAGDSLAGIYFDPESNLWGVDGTPLGKPGDLRFTYVPWHPTLNRRYDRDVAAGWAWGGAFDNQGYGSEEILATTLFRVYRSIGGDSTNLGRRTFASRMMLYLLLRGIDGLTQADNPQYARDFASQLIATDQLNWTSEGVFGGAYGKVIRWSFEKQGEYQSPLITHGGPGDGTITAPGQPPQQDVYIDDGRAGEYQYQAVHWHTTTIWNRRNPDSGTTHQEPALGETNYAYVKIKNRGTQTASNVVVRGFHTKPGAGLLWPNDFEPFTTAQINVGNLAGSNSEEKTVGPFEWTPNINAYGHDCMLMVVSASGDASNVDNFTAGEVIPEWRLVPNDNNVGQRNVQPVAGGSGMEGLLASLDGVSMWVGNPNPKRATMTLHVNLPDFLHASGWRLLFPEGDRFALRSGERREVRLHLQAGADFDRDTVEAAAGLDITVEVRADDNVMGGMTYRLDPRLRWPFNRRKRDGRDCSPAAKELLDCLGVPGQDVKDARIKEITVGIRMRDDDC